MSAVSRRRGIGPGGATALAVVAFAAVGLLFVWTIAQWINTGVVAFVNPVAALRAGEPWTPAHTAACVAVAAAVVVAATLAIIAASRSTRAKEDHAAVHMGRGRQVASVTPAQVSKLHKRLGLDPATYKGVTLGSLVAGGVPVRAPYESTLTLIAGPGSYKSVGVVIPNVLEAPGTCISTSVKDDVLTATLGHRSGLGRVFVFDPQGIAPAGADYAVWWNPLGGIHSIEDAENLAAVFAASYVDSSSENRFFEQEGVRLLADYLFAAAQAGNFLPVVQDWLSRDDSPAPDRVLADSHPVIADRIRSAQAVTERTRSGIFAYARGAVAFLGSDELRRWVQPGHGRSELDPIDLVAAPHDTLYLMSKEGRGSAGPLVSALSKTLLDAAERLAESSPGGRMPVPFTVILDEAGNICRIPDLPDRYSHYRSRGIVVLTILQSQEQGEQVWPNGGFGKLWASSTHQMFAGGNASNTFLRDLSERIGDYEFSERSTSTGQGGTSSQVGRRTERIMDVSDLDSLTQGRMILFAAGSRATLVRVNPWFKDKRLRRLVNLPSQRVHRVAGEERSDVR